MYGGPGRSRPGGASPGSLFWDGDIQHPSLFWWEDPSTHVRVWEGQFEILFKDFPSEEFQEAFQHGVRIWASLLDPGIPVRLAAEYRPILYPGDAAVGTSTGCSSSNIDPDQSRFCWPRSLYNQVLGYQGTDHPDFEVIIRDIKDSEHYPGGWRLEKDWSPPPDQLDLITIVLHELAHGFGISTRFNWFGCCEAKSKSTTGRAPFHPYDIFVWTERHGRLTDLPSPSEELLEALGGNELFWGKTGWKNVHGEPMLTPEVAMGPVPLWHSARYRRGLDIVHLSPSDYPKGTVNSVMTIGYPGIALRHPGPILMAMLYDIGWNLKTDIPTTFPPVPDRRPGQPSLYPPTERPNVQLDVVQRGAWLWILVHWEDVPKAEYYRIRLTSRSGKPQHSGTWWGYAKSPHRYLVRESWGPFTIEVMASNDNGRAPVATVTWPGE